MESSKVQRNSSFVKQRKSMGPGYPNRRRTVWWNTCKLLPSWFYPAMIWGHCARWCWDHAWRFPLRFLPTHWPREAKGLRRTFLGDFGILGFGILDFWGPFERSDEESRVPCRRKEVSLLGFSYFALQGRCLDSWRQSEYWVLSTEYGTDW